MMKAILNLLVIGLAASVALSARDARATFEVSASFSIHARADFYGPLSADGAWIEVGSYGRCWRPVGVAVEWRPYCYGHWVWTDCGWYWESDEPWAWACYHYGCWVYDPVYYWIWVPGIEWAPAWVTWRVGGGYIGWAPTPPHGLFLGHVAASSDFVFIKADRFTEPVRPTAVVVNNTAIIRETTVINNMKRETKAIGGFGTRVVFVNQGPGLAAVEKASRSQIRTVPIQEAAGHARVPAGVDARSRGPEAAGKPASVPARSREPDTGVRGTPPGTLPVSPKPSNPQPFWSEPQHGTVPAEKRASPSRPTPAPGLEKTHPSEGPPRAGAAEKPNRPPEEKRRGGEQGKERGERELE